MNKDTKEIEHCTLKNGVQLPEILADGKIYELIIQNRRYGLRTKLWEMCNDCVTPKYDDLRIWKNRFLNPDRIPANGFDYYAKIMSENLYAILQEQNDIIVDEILSKQKLISEIDQQIDDYKQRLSDVQDAIANFKD